MTKSYGAGLGLVRKPAQRETGAIMEIREGTTGRVIGTLPRVWAVGTGGAVRDMGPVSEGRPVQAMAPPKVELAFYRKYTEAMLRRYAQMSMESGRVPSLLGKEMFRGRVTSYRVRGFDDVVIFCCDLEKCLKRLDATEQQLLKRITIQEYTQGETASMLGMSLRSCVLKYGQALDRLTGILLEVRMLEPLKSCQ